MTAAPSAVVRAWARANGYTVSDRGRIPLEVQAAYDAAHATSAEPQPQTPPPPAPQPPWPQVPPYGPPPPDHGRDGFAIAALILGIIPVFLGILGIVFGVVALNRIAGTAKRGRGMAIAGIVCGVLWLGGVVTAVVLADALEPDRDANGTVTGSGDVTASDLRVGDCAEQAPEGTTYTVHVVPCSEPHGGEVFAQFDLPGSAYPGEGEVDRFAAGGCRSRVDAYVGADPTDYELYYLVPTSKTWGGGDRQVTCLLGGPDGTNVTGSARTA